MNNLALLKFDPNWLKYGFITGSMLASLLDEFKKGEGLHSEHYRYKMFLNFVKD